VASGGRAPYTYSIPHGALPDGLTFSNGVISGTLLFGDGSSARGFPMTATDADGNIGIRVYEIATYCPEITIDLLSLPEGQAGMPFNHSIAASGGHAPYTFSLSGNALPVGLNLSTNGVLSGIMPTNYAFTITVVDVYGCSGSWVYENCPWISVNPDYCLQPPAGEAGQFYSFTNSATGGVPPYSFSLRPAGSAYSFAGALPDGLSLSTDGVISGVPSNSFAVLNVSIKATDANGCSGWSAYGDGMGVQHARVSIVTPTDNATVNSATISVGGNAGGSLRAIYGKPTGEPYYVSGPVYSAALSYSLNGGAPQIPWPGGNNIDRWSAYVNLAPGWNTFVINGVDHCGNTSSATNRYFYVPSPLIGSAGKYNGLFHEARGVSHQTAGYLTASLLDGGSFSGRLILDGDSISLSGKFNIDGTITKTISRAKKDKDDLTLTISVSGGQKMIGSVAGPGWNADLECDKVAFNLIGPTTNNYTMLLPGFAEVSSGPPGYSFGRVAITPAGTVKLNGGTADGLTASQTAVISRQGTWPIYIPLYKSVKVYSNGTINRSYHRGSILGWATITNNAPAGTLSWIKTVGLSGTYPAGFTNEASLLGSSYVAPSTGRRALEIANGTITLADGDLPSAITRSVSLNTNNVIAIIPADNLVKPVLKASKGLLSGTFNNPNTGTSTPIKGVVLQDQKIGGGFFVGTNQGGLMRLE
jgi:hypothetical protein